MKNRVFDIYRILTEAHIYEDYCSDMVFSQVKDFMMLISDEDMMTTQNILALYSIISE